jgi:uncharacterized protein (DUF1697 family)
MPDAGSRYVAMLRAVNVGGRKVPMARLRELFDEVGFTDVSTYIQTGNVIFTSDRSPGSRISDLEHRIDAEFGVPGTVILRSAADLAAVIEANPYLDDEPDQAKLHVTFLVGTPDPAKVAAAVVPAGETARFRVVGRDVFLHTPDGYGRTKVSNSFLERRLGTPATTRNWRTVLKLHDLAAG